MSLVEEPCHPCFCIRLIHTYIKKLGLKLNKFIQYDGNTWYLINGRRHRSKEVQDHPEILGYSLSPTEEGKSPTKLFHQSIAKVPSASLLLGLGKNKFWPKKRTNSGKLVDRPSDLVPSSTLVMGLSSNVP